MKKGLFFAIFLSFTTFSQEVDLSYYLPDEVYGVKIPPPKSIIGHEVRGMACYS